MTFLNAETVRKLSNREKFDSGILYAEPRIDILKEKIASGTLSPKVQEKWNTVLDLPETAKIVGLINPWDIPENYGEDGESNVIITARIHADFQAAVGYAFRYLVTGSEIDAAQAVAFIKAYSTISEFKTNAGSTLNWFNNWPLLIQAAMMVQNSKAYTFPVERAFKETLRLAIETLEPIAHTRANNWGSWGLNMEFAYALFTNDRERFDRGIQRWKDLFNDSVNSGFVVNNGGPAQGQIKNNVAVREVYRMGGGYGNGGYGLLYSALHLDALVIAAEWARAGGEWLYDHVSPDGSSLRGFWENIAREKRHGTPAFSGSPAYLNVQWYNTSNKESPGSTYYYSGYYTNRVGGSFYVLQELWPLKDAEELMHGGFTTVGFAPGVYPPLPAGQLPTLFNGVPILQDYLGMYGLDLLCSDRPLYG